MYERCAIISKAMMITNVFFVKSVQQVFLTFKDMYTYFHLSL